MLNPCTRICPGADRRAKGIDFDHVLGDEAPALRGDALSQVALRGTRLIREVAFFHLASRTLILVDLLENFTPATRGDKAQVQEGMARILDWDFERVILAHGDIITRNAKQIVAPAWQEIMR